MLLPWESKLERCTLHKPEIAKKESEGAALQMPAQAHACQRARPHAGFSLMKWVLTHQQHPSPMPSSTFHSPSRASSSSWGTYLSWLTLSLPEFARLRQIWHTHWAFHQPAAVPRSAHQGWLGSITIALLSPCTSLTSPVGRWGTKTSCTESGQG